MCTLRLVDEQPSIAVIVNRAAHKGGAARRWPAIEAELSARLGAFAPYFTAAPGHATELARTAVARANFALLESEGIPKSVAM